MLHNRPTSHITLSKGKTHAYKTSLWQAWD